MYINCGGQNVKTNGSTYEGDAAASSGAAIFYRSEDEWGISSTGDFMDDNDFQNRAYIENMPSLNINELYQTARVSPISLTYYHRCLENGNYTVSLHFAEIRFKNDNTYNSLGRRLFDVYIQVIIYMICRLWIGLNNTVSQLRVAICSYLHIWAVVLILCRVASRIHFRMLYF